MPKLLGARFSKIGFHEARIDGLAYDLTHNNEPKNSLVITGNGGGKTTQVHLIFSIFLPQKRELMTKKSDAGRYFEYYFENNEIAIVASEWSIPNSQVSLGGIPSTRVVGRVTQFTNRDKNESDTFFFSFIADEALGIDDLPLTSSIPHRVPASARPKTMAEAKKYLTTTFGSNPNRELYVGDKVEQWQSYLRSIWFNVDVFRIMQMFTLSEGDAASFLNKYCSQDAILKLITEEVLDKKSTDGLREMLVEYRETIRKAPQTRSQIGAYDDLISALSPLQPVADKLVLAEELYAKSTEDLGKIAAQIKATTEAETLKLEELADSKNADEAKLVTARKHFGDMCVELRGVLERLAEMSYAEAKINLADQTRLLGDKTTLLAAMRAMVDEVEVLAAKTGRDDLTRQMEALTAATRDPADELAMAEHLFSSYLEADRLHAQGIVNDTEKRAKDVTLEKNGILSDRLERLSSLAGRRSTEVILKKGEAEREESLAALLDLDLGAAACLNADGSLLPSSTMENLKGELSEIQNSRETARSNLESAKTEFALTESKLNVKKESLVSLTKVHAAAVKAHEVYHAEHNNVVKLKGIGDVFELAVPDLFFPGLDVKLKKSATLNDLDIMKLEGDISALTARIEAIEKNGGLMPSSDDVETVLEALRKEHVKVRSYWQVFSEQNRSPYEAENELRKDPFRVGGVAVLGGPKEVQRAEGILAGFPVLSPVVVSDYADVIVNQGLGENKKQFTVLPDAKLAIDRQAAENFCIKAQSDIGTMEATIVKIKAAREAALSARDALVAFLGKYSETSAAVLVSAITTAEKDLLSCSAEIQTLTEKVSAVQGVVAEAEGIFNVYCARSKQMVPLIDAIQKHISRHEDGRPALVAGLQELARMIIADLSAIEVLEERLLVIEKTEGDANKSAEKARAALAEVTKEIHTLNGARKEPTPAFSSLAGNTASARSLYVDKGQALEMVNTNAECLTVKAKLLAAKEHYEKAQERWDNKYRAIKPEALQEALRQISGAVASEYDYVKVSEERELVQISQIKAEEALKRAGNERDDLKQSHFGQKIIPCILDMQLSGERKTDLETDIEKTKLDMDTLTQAVSTWIEKIRETREEIRTLETLTYSITEDFAPLAGGDISVYPNSEIAKAELRTAQDEVRQSGVEVKSLNSKLALLNNDLVKVMDDDSSLVISRIVAQIREEKLRCGGILNNNISAFIEKINNLIAALTHELESMERNEQKVTAQVMVDVQKAFKLLGWLETRSKIPALGGIWKDWAGMSFIRFRTQVKVDSDEARQIVADTISKISGLEKDLPSGDEIVHLALAAVLGSAYTIETLKPQSIPTTKYAGIEHPLGLTSWSGGERLAGAALFFLAISHLMTVDHQGGNVLFLDNPFASCTDLNFIRLVIALTREYNVQIVAYTPIEDKQIRRLFPLNVMIRKGGADGIIKGTGQPVVRYQETIYNEGEITTLKLNQEWTHASA